MRLFDGRGRRLRRAAVVGAVAAATLGAGSAAASAATLTTTVDTAAPEQGIPVQLTFSGTPSSDADLWVVVRPAGGVPCQASEGADNTAAGDASQNIVYEDYEPGGAPFTVDANWTPGSTGAYIICAWLEPDSLDTGATPEAGPVTTTVSARGPQISAFSVAIPTAPVRNDAFAIDYTTQTDQQLTLYSTIKPAGGQPCAASYELEAQNESDSESEIFGDDDDQEVYGGPTVTSATATEPAGSYIICSWIEGPNGGEVDGALTTPLSIPGPPPKVVKVAPAVAVGSVHAVPGHGAVIAGTTVTGLSGALGVKVSCERHVDTGSATAADGHFAARLPLPQGCRSGDRITVLVTWAGSATTTTGSATTTAVVVGVHHRSRHHRHTDHPRRRRRRHHHRR